MKENVLKEEIDALNLDTICYVKHLKESCDIIPQAPGVYVVLGNYPEIPAFLEKGTGPEFHFKKGMLPQPMNYPLKELEKKWVEDTLIMYIGKTDETLRKRISTYIKFGMGKDVAHRGGRAIWQLPDSDNLLIGWKIIDPSLNPSQGEKEWLKEFKERHNFRLPFANWKE